MKGKNTAPASTRARKPAPPKTAAKADAAETRSDAKGAPAAPQKKRVFLVDDHPMMLDGMRRLIDSEPGLECCGGARSAEEALSLFAQSRPDLVITDITLPNRSGLDLIKDLLAMCPDVLVFVYSMHDESFYAERALRAGARGYLMKEAGSERMLEAIRAVLDGQVSVSAKMASRILNLFSKPPARRAQSSVENLTDREFEIFRLIGQGKSTKEIAAHLHLSHKTVAVHRGHIKEKLNLANAGELVHQAIRWTETRPGAE